MSVKSKIFLPLLLLLAFLSFVPRKSFGLIFLGAHYHLYSNEHSKSTNIAFKMNYGFGTFAIFPGGITLMLDRLSFGAYPNGNPPSYATSSTVVSLGQTFGITLVPVQLSLAYGLGTAENATDAPYMPDFTQKIYIGVLYSILPVVGINAGLNLIRLFKSNSVGSLQTLSARWALSIGVQVGI